MPKSKPECEDLRRWLVANLGKSTLGALTGTDARALAAAVHVVELYSHVPSPRIAHAFGIIVSEMQPSTRYLAFHAIAKIMEWSTREDLWALANLPPLPPNSPECANARG